MPPTNYDFIQNLSFKSKMDFPTSGKICVLNKSRFSFLNKSTVGEIVVRSLSLSLSIYICYVYIYIYIYIHIYIHNAYIYIYIYIHTYIHTQTSTLACCEEEPATAVGVANS